eukprot:6512155-Pyramimonas_sp.AAC.1
METTRGQRIPPRPAAPITQSKKLPFQFGKDFVRAPLSLPGVEQRGQRAVSFMAQARKGARHQVVDFGGGCPNEPVDVDADWIGPRGWLRARRSAPNCGNTLAETRWPWITSSRAAPAGACHAMPSKVCHR